MTLCLTDRETLAARSRLREPARVRLQVQLRLASGSHSWLASCYDWLVPTPLVTINLRTLNALGAPRADSLVFGHEYVEGREESAPSVSVISPITTTSIGICRWLSFLFSIALTHVAYPNAQMESAAALTLLPSALTKTIYPLRFQDYPPSNIL